MVVANRFMHWEEGIVKLKSQLTDAMDANKTLSSTATKLTREKNLLTDKLTKVGIEASMKDKELRRTTKSYEKTLDQLKALSEQMETVGACAVEEYKSSDACDDNNTKYFLAGFELLRKQAKKKYPDLDFDVFQPYEDDDSVALVEERNEVAASVDTQLTDDATT
jgi:predicted nuclease with TOPRIM domain